MTDEPIDRKPDYRQGTTGGSASSPTREEELGMRPIATGAVVSFVLAHVIGWIPVVGAILTGFAGGYVARTRIRGIYATMPAAVICMAWYWIVSYIPEIPHPLAARLEPVLAPADVILYGPSGTIFALVFMGQFLFCILGGWYGGVLQEKRSGRTAVEERSARPF